MLTKITQTSANPANFPIESVYDKNDLGKLIIAKPISADNTAFDYVQYQFPSNYARSYHQLSKFTAKQMLNTVRRRDNGRFSLSRPHQIDSRSALSIWSTPTTMRHFKCKSQEPHINQIRRKFNPGGQGQTSA